MGKLIDDLLSSSRASRASRSSCGASRWTALRNQVDEMQHAIDGRRGRVQGPGTLGDAAGDPILVTQLLRQPRSATP
jgi:hypothetical protein